MFGIGRCFGSGVYGYVGGIWIIPLVMGVLRIVLLAVTAYLIYKLFIRNKRNSADSSYSPAMEILNERFAKGEINENEYNTKKKQISK